MQVEEYQKRLKVAVALLGEEAGRRYMARRLREGHRQFIKTLQTEIRQRLADLSAPFPLRLTITIGPSGVRISGSAARGGRK